jgi:nucleoside-diphosphate-sugar epimerase
MAKILIIGCGDIGSRLAKVLAQDGHSVTGLKRNPPPSSDVSINYFKADIASPAELDALNTDFEQLFFIVSPDGRSEQSYRAVYQTGVNNLLGHFSRQQRNPPWIFVSSTSVYGQSQGEWVDEQSPAQPQSATGQFIRQAEQRLTAANPGNIAVRFSGIYGPGRDYLLKTAMQAPAIQRDPPYYTNCIHQQDCAGVLAFLFNRRIAGAALEQCYLASDDAPAPLWDVVTWLAERMHCCSPTVKTAGNDAPMNKRCDNRRLKALGYKFRYPSYREGYLEMLGQ